MMRFFEDVDDKYVRCTACGDEKNQLIARSGSTSNLKRHMVRAHRDLFHNLQEQGAFKSRIPKAPSKPVVSDKPSRSRLKNRFFEDVDDTYWRCIPCGDANKLIARSGNTSNLKRHLQVAHKEQLQEFLAEEIEAGNAPRANSKRAKKTANNQYTYTCRACLNVDPAKMYTSLLEEPMKSTFWECTAIDVSEDENVPMVLCSLCVARCEAAKHFRDMVHDNDDKLRENHTVYLANEEMDTLDDNSMVLETVKMDSESLDIQHSEDAILESEEEEDETIEEEGEVNFYETAAEEVVVDEVFVINFDGEDQRTEIPISEEVVEEEIKQRKIAISFTNQSQIFTCEFCEEEMPNRTSCANHYQSDHPNEVYTCQECNKSFISAQTWRKHACPITSVKFGCELCSEVFLRREKLKKHMDEHMGTVKLYPCPICGHQFKQKGNMDAHVKRHSDEKPFACSECQKTFKERRELMRHLTLVHSNVRPFVCGQCDKAFGFKFMLDRHMRTHTGEKPYVCKVDNCDQKLSSSHSLSQHMASMHPKVAT